MNVIIGFILYSILFVDVISPKAWHGCTIPLFGLGGKRETIARNDGKSSVKSGSSGVKRFLTLRSKVRIEANDIQQSTKGGQTPTRFILPMFNLQHGDPITHQKHASHRGNSKKKKILVLMSDTGGGHRASAEALDQAIKDRYHGKIGLQIIDIWTDHARWPYNKFVPVYRFLAKHPLLWRGFYMYGLFPPTKLLTEISSKRSSYKGFKLAIEQADPDLVVSVHPLCQLMPISVVKEMNKKRSPSKPPIPFITVVTDLGGAHSCWFDRRADAVFVPSEAVRKIALRNGMPEAKIKLVGLPIRPAFWKAPKSKASMRKALGLTPKVRTVMLMGGGDGVGGIGPIATEVAAKLKKLDVPSQLVVICGHNKKIADKLSSQIRSSERFNVMIKGFVKNIDQFMTASDCLITKAGPGTIAESMTRGLPLILSSYLPGQVKFNNQDLG